MHAVGVGQQQYSDTSLILGGMGMRLCNDLLSLARCTQEHRGVQRELTYLDQSRVMLKYSLPLSEVVVDFYDQIKTISSGYARSDSCLS